VRRLHLFVFVVLFSVMLESCREPAATAVPALVKELRSSESGDRNRAALRLASYGREASPAVHSLVVLLGDENSGVRSSAAYALRQINTPEAQRALDAYQK
jgi:HEAT repeat protein